MKPKGFITGPGKPATDAANAAIVVGNPILPRVIQRKIVELWQRRECPKHFGNDLARILFDLTDGLVEYDLLTEHSQIDIDAGLTSQLPNDLRSGDLELFGGPA